MRSAKSSFIVGLIGTEITTEAKPDFQLPAKIWVITDKLEELSVSVTQEEIDWGLLPGFAAAKFLCYLKDDPTKQPAFMRIYCQIPTQGAELSKAPTTKPVPTRELDELVAFKALMKNGCLVVPQLLGYQEGTQGNDGIIPGGFTTTIVWEKVPGVPLSQEYFWGLDRSQRDTIRAEFRRVYE